MSSNPTDTTQTQKNSTRHPSTPHEEIDAALADDRCPHCGGRVETSLAEHIYRGCDASAWGPEQPEPTEPTDTHPEPPTLDEAPETIDVDVDDLEARARLARELSQDGREWFAE